MRDERTASRIPNARPISTTPPDLRDTTREIENEARRAEYARSRTPARSEGFQARPTEGREPAGAVKASVATRPIAMTSGTSAARQADDGVRARH